MWLVVAVAVAEVAAEAAGAAEALATGHMEAALFQQLGPLHLDISCSCLAAEVRGRIQGALYSCFQLARMGN